jgi:hypothetical protein
MAEWREGREVKKCQLSRYAGGGGEVCAGGGTEYDGCTVYLPEGFRVTVPIWRVALCRRPYSPTTHRRKSKKYACGGLYVNACRWVVV